MDPFKYVEGKVADDHATLLEGETVCGNAGETTWIESLHLRETVNDLPLIVFPHSHVLHLVQIRLGDNHVRDRLVFLFGRYCDAIGRVL